MIRTLIFSLTLTLGLLTYGAAEAQLNDTMINIEADQLSVSQNNKSAVFSGNVKISQDDILLGADTITIQFNDDNDLSNIIADGSVTIIYDENTATGEKAVYELQSSVITLSGNVVLLQNQNALKGSELSYNLKTGDISLKATQTGRVKGSFKLDE